MLVLTRKTGQRLRVDNDIVFTVLKTGKNRVRIGIDAPEHVAVHREEVWDEIRERHKQDFPAPPCSQQPPIDDSRLAKQETGVVSI